MLILGRTPAERIVIGQELRITVMSVHGHRVRLVGIEAPAERVVRRGEVRPRRRGPRRPGPGGAGRPDRR